MGIAGTGCETRLSMVGVGGARQVRGGGSAVREPDIRRNYTGVGA